MLQNPKKSSCFWLLHVMFAVGIFQPQMCSYFITTKHFFFAQLFMTVFLIKKRNIQLRKENLVCICFKIKFNTVPLGRFCYFLQTVMCLVCGSGLDYRSCCFQAGSILISLQISIPFQKLQSWTKYLLTSHVLAQIAFTKSETGLDYHYQKMNVRVVPQIVEQLNKAL